MHRARRHSLSSCQIQVHLTDTSLTRTPRDAQDHPKRPRVGKKKSRHAPERGRTNGPLIALPFLAGSLVMIGSVEAFDPTADGSIYAQNPLRTPDAEIVELQRLQDSPYLSGQYVKIQNDLCSGCDHSLADRSGTNHFIYDPTAVQFSEVMAYHHMDSFHAYVRRTLGFADLISTQLPVNLYVDRLGAGHSSVLGIEKIDVGTRIDADYDGDWIPDAEFDMDLAKSADLLVHEYAHAVIDRLSPLTVHALPDFLEEGWADYLTASYFNDPYIGEWINQSAFRQYRRSALEGVSALDLWPIWNKRADARITNDEYTRARAYYNSMYWSGFLWRLRERISMIAEFDEAKARELTDSLVLKGIQYFDQTSGNAGAPLDEMLVAKEAIKDGLQYFKGLSGFNYQYDWYYQYITAADIDAAYERRYRRAFAGEPYDWYYVSPDHRELAAVRQTGGSDVVLALIDTGISSVDHYEMLGSEDTNFNGIQDEPDLNGNGLLDTGELYGNVDEIPADGIDNDQNGLIDDVYGWDFVGNDPDPTQEPCFCDYHGVNVLKHARQLLWRASIMPVLNSRSATEWMRQQARLTAAVHYALDNGADVVNVSQPYFDTTSPSTQQPDSLNPERAFNMAGFNEVRASTRPDGTAALVVAAAGNDNFDLDENPIYPASFALPNVVSVTATDATDGFSTLNYGKYSVDLSATTEGKTSYAAPVVSAAIALVLSEQKDRQEAHPGYRSLTAGEIKYLLLMSVDPLASLEGRVVSGGRLNVNRYLEFYENDADWDGYPEIIERLFNTDPNDRTSYPDMLNGDDDGDGLVNHLELGYGTIPIMLIAGENYSDRLYPIYLNADGTVLPGVTSDDSDGDGLSDLAEVQPLNGFYTDPANPDTDGDGIVDGDSLESSPSYARLNLENIALHQTATVSDSLHASLGGANAIDGDPSTYWSTAVNTSPPHWLAVQFSVPPTIYAVRTTFESALLVPSDYTLQFSDNGDFDAGLIYEQHVSNNTQAERTDVMPLPLEANYVRILITDPRATGSGNDFVRIYELEVLGTQPRNMAVGKAAVVNGASDPESPGSNANDGITSGLNYWSTDTSISGPHWLRINLEAKSSISAITVYFHESAQIPASYTLQFSDVEDFSLTGTRAPYEVVVDNMEGATSKTTKLYAPVAAQYVRLLLDGPSGATHDVRVVELEVNGVAP